MSLVGLRMKFITAPLYRALKRRTPPVSDTERTALEAGSAWWEKTLFCGAPDWDTLLNTPAPRLSEAEQSFLDNEVEQLCAMANDWEIHRQSDLGEDIWTFLKSNRFFGMIIPREYGGLGFSAAAHSAIITKLATRSTALAVTVMVPNSLGPGELLLHYGTDAQKQRYLPRLAEGLEVPCFALTSPKAGSDATSFEDIGVVCKREFEGKTRLGLALRWNKRYITLAPVATLLGLAVKVHDPEQLLGETFSDRFGSRGANPDDPAELGITCILVPTRLPGVQIGRRHNPMETPFQNGPTSGEEVFVPLEYVIGGDNGIGQGWRMLVECLSVGRSLSLPALASAAGQVAAYSSSAYARVREQFNRPIGRFEGVQDALAEIATCAVGIDAVRELTVSAVDAGEKPAVASAMAKHFTTERARRAINAAMDVHGGKAVMCGPGNYLANLYKSIPISITVEGANILTRSLIVFGQGAIRCHPHLLDELNLLERGDDDLQAFDRLTLAHLRYHVTTLARVAMLGASGGWTAKIPPRTAPCARYYRRLARLSAKFAYLADLFVVTFGGDIKRREMLCGRFSDALSAMYATAAILKRYYDTDRPPPERELIALACEHYQHEAEIALYETCRNLPGRILSWYARAALFPLGRRLRPPADALRRKVAGQMLEPDGLRLGLARDLYRDTFRSLDRAMELARGIENARGRPDEDAQVRAWREAVAEAIEVDDFEP